MELRHAGGLLLTHSSEDTGIRIIIFSFPAVQYECCGLDGPYDFVNVPAEQWLRFREGNDGSNVTLDFPVACCKSSGDFPEDFQLANENCALDQNEDNTNMQVRDLTQWLGQKMEIPGI